MRVKRRERLQRPGCPSESTTLDAYYSRPHEIKQIPKASVAFVPVQLSIACSSRDVEFLADIAKRMSAKMQTFG